MQPSAQGIASLFMGNPGALAARVDQDRKQSPMGIPDDLRQLMALNIVTNETDAAKRQQAMNELRQMAPNGQPPTVAESLRQQAVQKLQARMVQEQQKQQALQQMVAGLPATGVPANVPQPQGIDQAPVEFGMASGGIVSFNGEEESLVQSQPEAEKPKTQELIDYLKDPVGAARQIAEQEVARYKQEIPAPDRAIRDKLMAELERQKAGMASPTGLAGLAEYMSQIAATPRGLSSFEAGAAGARGVQGLEAARQAGRGAIIEKQLRLEQEQYDANRQYAKDVFGVKNSEFDRMVKTYTTLFKEKGEDDRLAKRHANDLALEDVRQKGRIDLEKIKEAADVRLEGIRQKGRLEVANVPGSYERMAEKITDLEEKGTPEALIRANRLRENLKQVQGSTAAVGNINAQRKNLEAQLRVHQNKLKDYRAKPDEIELANQEIRRITEELRNLPSPGVTPTTPSPTPDKTTQQAAKPLPSGPDAKKSLQVGTVYETKYGNLKWDGKNFVTP